MAHATATDGTQIYFDVIGEEGPWTVLIQGLGLSSRFWGDVPKTLPGQRVLLVDNRGTGRSGKAFWPYAMATLADDVVSAMDAAGARTGVVCGISMGGMIAQHIAARHPARVEGLVLLATTPGVPWGVPPGPGTVALLSTLGFKSSLRSRRDTFRKLFFGGRAREDGERLVDELLQQWAPLLHDEIADPHTFMLQLVAASGHVMPWALSAFAGPVHVVHGAADEVIPSANAARMRLLFGQATVEELPNVGHAVPFEDRDVIRRGVAQVRSVAH